MVIQVLAVLLAPAALAAAPTIASFSPTNGPVGTSVTLTGTGFTGANRVEFNGVDATFTVVSDTQITTTVPTDATDGPISVRVPSEGVGFSSTSFDVTPASAPTVTSFTPTSGPVGTSVVITGTNFTGATAVQFNGTSATFTVNSATQITATVPSGASTGAITVTTGGGTATSSSNFTVVQQAPTISSFSPTNGPVGTSVTLTGTGFTGANRVEFNGVDATFTVVSDTQITTTVPTGATDGPISVRVPSEGEGFSSTNFDVTLTHARTITLRLRHRAARLIAKGLVSVADGFTQCAATVPVKIQKRRSGRWVVVARTTTSTDGHYRVRVANRSGRYRARAPKITAANDLCLAAVSTVKTYVK